mmetsp:Transcript_8014/g.14860  ORF Transcript_8014/g.14860 Transcript_8014/m.14860 type:complete len:275 (-) Transcript_8014:901-1725(-)
MNSAKALVSSVFPTPLGPSRRNVPIGFLCWCKPARAIRTAFEMASRAMGCPTTRFSSSFSMCSSFCRSCIISFERGTPVCRATTDAMSASVTASDTTTRARRASSALMVLAFSSVFNLAASISRSRSGMSWNLICDARSNFPSFVARSNSNLSSSSLACTSCSLVRLLFSCIHSSVNCWTFACFSARIFSIFSSRFLAMESSSVFKASCSMRRVRISLSKAAITSGLLSCCMRSLDAASSRRSMALSGNLRSVRYRLANVHEATTAESWIFTPW